MSSSQDIRSSWKANAANWIATLDHGEIESRTLVTNEAIVQQVLKFSPGKILDLGCGEGWLSRTLRGFGIEAWGTDATQELIHAAVERGGEHYFRLDYREIVDGQHCLPTPFDAAVINFALLDKDDTESLLLCLPQLLRPNGVLFIQTLHPSSVSPGDAYRSGWREGSWDGLRRAFILPYRWYFRTLEDWFRLFKKSGFAVEELTEPVHPLTNRPASIIFTLKKDSLTNVLA